jgi:hypothetical protein
MSSTISTFRNEVIDSIKYLSNINHFQNKWITDDVILNLLQIVQTRDDIISTSNKNALTTKIINKCTQLKKFNFFYDLNHPNKDGIFKQQYRPRSSTRVIHCYFFCTNSASIPPAQDK